MSNINLNKTFNGLSKLRDYWQIAKDNFTKIETGHNALDDRVDTIITTPIDGTIAAQEIVDARKGEISLGAKIDVMDNEVASHMADTMQRAINVKYPPALLTAVKMDGVTDDSTAIQALINYVATNGGTLFFPEGVYIINTKLVVSSPYTSFYGTGSRKTTFRSTSSNTILEFTAGTGANLVCDIGFDAAGTAQNLLNLNNALSITIENCYFSTENAGNMVVCTSPYTNFMNCGFNCNNTNGIAVVLDTNTGLHIGTHFSNCSFSGTGNGLQIKHSDPLQHRIEGVRLIDCAFSNTGAYNLYIDDSYFTQITGCGFDLAKDNNIILVAPTLVFINNCWIGLNGTPNVGASSLLILPTADRNGTDIIISNCSIFGGDYCIYIDVRAWLFGVDGYRPKNVKILNNTFSNASATSLLFDSADDCIIKGNTEIGSPSNGSYSIVGNNNSRGSYIFGDNIWSATPPTLLDATSKYLASEDKGATLKKSGVQAITTAATTINISHGCSLTPDVIQVTPEGNTGAFYISNISAAQFTVTWANAVNGILHWTAEVNR